MGAEPGAEIARGSLVELHLALTLGDGTEALSTFGEAPLRLRIGDGTLDPGLEKPLLGLGAGSGFDILLPAGQAYASCISPPPAARSWPVAFWN